eukprot:832098-Rhodomonas_salina.1
MHVFVNVNATRTHHLCQESTCMPMITVFSLGPSCRNWLSCAPLCAYPYITIPSHAYITAV